MTTTKRLVLSRSDLDLLREYVPEYDQMDADELSERLGKVKNWLDSQAVQELQEAPRRSQRVYEDEAVAQTRRRLHPDMGDLDHHQAAAAPNYGIAPGERAALRAGQFARSMRRVERALEPAARPMGRVVRWYHWLAYCITGVIFLTALGSTMGIIDKDFAAMVAARAKQLTGQTKLVAGQEFRLDWSEGGVTYQTLNGCIPAFYMVDATGVMLPPPGDWTEDQRAEFTESYYEGCHPFYATSVAVSGYRVVDNQLWMGVHAPRAGVSHPSKTDLNDWVDVWTAADWWNIKASTVQEMPGTLDASQFIGKNIAESKIALRPMDKVYETPNPGTTPMPTAAVIQPTSPPAPQATEQPPAPPVEGQGQIVTSPVPTEEPAPTVQPTTENVVMTIMPITPTVGPIYVIATNTPWPTANPSQPFVQPNPNRACNVYITCLGGQRPTAPAVPTNGAQEGRKVAANGQTYSDECNAIDWQYDGDVQKTTGEDTVKLSNCQAYGST